MKIVALSLISILIVLAVISVIAFMRTGSGGRGAHRVPADRDRPMTPWAEERALGDPQSDTGEGWDGKGEGDRESPHGL
jgi:hypothetical protein